LEPAAQTSLVLQGNDVQNECLDWLLIIGRRHLAHVLRVYIQHYNRERPHRGLALQPPEPLQVKPPPCGDVRRRDRLGGLAHEDYGAQPE
jgi:putative transposase